MLARLAKVVWWLGLIVGVLCTLPYIVVPFIHKGCSAALQLQASIENDRNTAIDKYVLTHPAHPNDTPDKVAALLEAAANSPDDIRDTQEHKERVAECQKPAESSAAIFGWVFTFLLWSLAYILGGSFWLPARRHKSGS